MSPAAVQQQAIIQNDTPAAAAPVENSVDTIQADVSAPEVYEDDQQFGKKIQFALKLWKLINCSSLKDALDNDISQTNVKDDVAAAKPVADDGNTLLKT